MQLTGLDLCVRLKGRLVGRSFNTTTIVRDYEMEGDQFVYSTIEKSGICHNV